MKKLLIIFLIFFPSSTWAFWVVGSGLTKCDRFLKDKEEGLLYYQMTGWMQGYISGRNEENNFSKDISVDEIYCLKSLIFFPKSDFSSLLDLDNNGYSVFNMPFLPKYLLKIKVTSN